MQTWLKISYNADHEVYHDMECIIFNLYFLSVLIKQKSRFENLSRSIRPTFGI